MTLDTSITRVGSSFYVLIPSYLVKDFKLYNGFRAEVSVDNDVIVIKIKRDADAVRG